MSKSATLYNNNQPKHSRFIYEQQQKIGLGENDSFEMIDKQSINDTVKVHEIKPELEDNTKLSCELSQDFSVSLFSLRKRRDS